MTELAATLLEGQAEWLTIATDVCRITRPARPDEGAYVPGALGASDPEIDPETGQYPDQGRVTVYEGPCRMQVKADINSNVVETTAGEREWTYLTSQLQLPVLPPPDDFPGYVEGDPADVDVDYICEMVTAPYDPALVGTIFNIQGPYHKSQAVYRRFRVREVAA